MPRFNAPPPPYARATYALRAKDIVEVLCHRKNAGAEEYLVRWAIGGQAGPRARCSWHTLPELWRVLYLVQEYIESRLQPDRTSETSSDALQLPALPQNRKRKSPDPDHASPRERRGERNEILRPNGLLTPHDNLSQASRASSVMSVGSSLEAAHASSGPDNNELRLYGVTLRKKEGHLLAQKCNESPLLNPSKLPEDWLQTASITPVDQAERFMRQKFLEMIKPVGNVRLENKIDSTTPSLNFTFIDRYVFQNGIYVTPIEAVEGCPAPCRANMGGFCGCEYTQKCGCLEYAAVDEINLQKKDGEVYEAWKKAREDRVHFDSLGLPKRFPYSKKSKDAGAHRPQTLVSYYLESRNIIYECNQNCNCGPVCKSRLVQKGRKVPLTVFKTKDRGWGVKCDEYLVRGEFIDTYLGEVISQEEADRREEKAGEMKNSYFFGLDKFTRDPNYAAFADIDPDDCHVVDGQHMGGPSRFINHSCEPNCRQYTVSYNKNDPYVYNLAFFAYDNIPAGEELTFDYMDGDEEEEEEAVRRREEALRDPANAHKIRCNCGARKCRGFLW
ncbi:Histone-lysine N-methyltransferase SUV39H1 [Lecanosticta acicola]|uniref:Histone-lysine N-methyltransferase SUV39H1 n=1 Tax=Lecanosticta acicola TaxID=111012 RepID=A0AAI8Z6P7_9PEZI|nr:Histone-lysine N-methyltransferase SUV39H1 [Lecanosticta acicola]